MNLVEKMLEYQGETVQSLRERIQTGGFGDDKKKVLFAFLTDFEGKQKSNPFGGRLERNELKYGKKVKEYVLNYYGEIYSIYEMLEGQKN